MKTKEKITGELLKAIKHIDISNDPKDVIEFHKSGKYHEITTNFVKDEIVIAYKQEALQHIEEALNHVFDFRKDLSGIVSEEFVMRKLKEIIKNALLKKDTNKNNLIISDVKTLLRNIRNKDNYIIFTRVFNLKCSNIINCCIHLSSGQKRFPLFELFLALKFKPQNLILEPRYFQV